MLAIDASKGRRWLVCATLALILALSCCLSPYSLAVRADALRLERQEANANPGLAAAAAFAILVAGLTGISIASSTTLTYDGFKTWSANNGYSSASASLDDSIFNLQNFGTVAIASCTSFFGAIIAWLVAENALTADSASATIPTTGFDSASVLGVNVPFGSLPPNISAQWSDSSSWAAWMLFSYGSSVEIWVFSSDSVLYPYLQNGKWYLSLDGTVYQYYKSSGSYRSSYQRQAAGQIVTYDVSYAATDSWKYLCINPAFAGTYAFLASSATAHNVSSAAATLSNGVWSENADVIGGDSTAEAIDGYPLDRNTSDVDAWAADVIDLGGSITVPNEDVVNPGWDDYTTGTKPQTVVPSGVNSLSQAAFLDYVMQLVRAGKISIADAIDLINSYVAANSLTAVDAISMTLQAVGALVGALMGGFDGWDFNHLTDKLKNLPWGNIWPFCYIYDLKNLLSLIVGNGGVWDYTVTLDFSGPISDVTGDDLNASFVFDLSDWLPSFAPTVQFFFIAQTVIGLLWFSIAMWLKVPTQSKDGA